MNISRHFKQFLTVISPRLNTEIVYFFKFKKRINLNEPRTLDEKIQWLKLNAYNKNPLVTQCADKYAVRDYVKSCGCSEILNDLYGVYDSVDEIKWDELPEKFVIKWNFGCGQNLICFDKSKLNLKSIVTYACQSLGKIYSRQTAAIMKNMFLYGCQVIGQIYKSQTTADIVFTTNYYSVFCK